jgi:hypothetical protein
VNDTDTRMAELQAEVVRLRDLIDRDRTGLAEGLAAVLRLAASWAWVGRPGEWGCYEQAERNLASLREEISRCLESIEETAYAALRQSGTRAGLAFDPERDRDRELDSLPTNL